MYSTYNTVSLDSITRQNIIHLRLFDVALAYKHKETVHKVNIFFRNKIIQMQTILHFFALKHTIFLDIS